MSRGLPRRRLVLAAAAAAGLAGAGWAGRRLWQRLHPPVYPERVVFQLTDGRRTRVADYAGRPLLVNFWQSACRPCLEEMPELARLYRELSPRGLEIIGVVVWYDRFDKALETARRLDLPYPVALDPMRRVSAALAHEGYTPFSVLIGPEGEVRHRWDGKIPLDDLRRTLEPMLAAP